MSAVVLSRDTMTSTSPLLELSGWGVEIITNLVLSFLAALGFALFSAVCETATYRMYLFLERQGLLIRLMPEVETKLGNVQWQTFKTFVGSTWPTLFFVSFIKDWLIGTAVPEFTPLKTLLFAWGVVILHDAWFWLVHKVSHENKWLYRNMHQVHHLKNGNGDLTVFETADMDTFEAFILFMGFYGLMLAYYIWRGRWNPIDYFAVVFLEASMNMAGHCGYHMPLWLQFIVTAGCGVFPGAAESRTHFIHHLDPRCNRALYFTWWDRLDGTYRPHHPKIRQFTKEEKFDYDFKIIKYTLKMMKRF